MQVTRALAAVLLPAAALLTAATAASAAPRVADTKPVVTPLSYVQICPGIICEPFWKTNEQLILRKVP